MNRKDVWSEKTGTKSAEGEMRRKEKENFTRRRCWWSKRRDETGVRDSETKGRQKDKGWEKETEWDTERRDFEGKHPYERQREKKRTQGLLFVRPTLPPTDY